MNKDLPDEIIKAIYADSNSRPQNLRFAINEWAINETWKAINLALEKQRLGENK